MLGRHHERVLWWNPDSASVVVNVPSPNHPSRGRPNLKTRPGSSGLFRFLLHTGKVSSATVTRGPPLRLLTRTTNYMIFPGQPPPTAGVNCPTLLTSSRQTSRCPSPIRVRPSREPAPLWIPYPGTRGGEGEGGRMVYTFDSFFR